MRPLPAASRRHGRRGPWRLSRPVLLAVGAALSGCGETGSSDGIPAPFHATPDGPVELAAVRAGPAVGRWGPHGEPFEVALRTPELTQHPCSSCHEDEPADTDGRSDVHADVPSAHPAETGAACSTCHAADDPARLPLEAGGSASLDEAYRLCAQCHYAQADDWAGGAHGKRIAGWQGRRVVMSCTACHDPHAPGFEPRIPFRGPRIPRAGGGRP